MSEPKISVIVPVYNVAEYIAEALESLLNQTMMEDIEVIMIDDGSTDESRYIIERYALDYDNFHAYHKDNEGQGIARNYGLNLAKGEYVTFMDSDDYVPSNAYETLYNLAIKNDSDIAVGNALRFALMNVWQDNLFKNAFSNVDAVIDSTTLNQMPSLLWDTVTWNKLYKREFLMKNAIEFPKRKVSYQDIPFSFKAYVLAQTISITPEICYYWRLRNDNSSVTQQDYNIKNFKDRLYILGLVKELMDECDVDESIENEEYLKWINHDLKFFLKRFDKFPNEFQRTLFDEISRIVDFIPDKLIENLNSYKKVIFKIIKNHDFESFVAFAPLENDLYECPEIPEFLDDGYKEYFDFHEAMKDEELLVELVGAHGDEKNLFLDIKGSLNYLADDEHFDITSVLRDSQNEYPLDINNSKNTEIIIPLSLIEDKRHLQVKVKYGFRDFEKIAFVKNRHKQSIELDDKFIDLNFSTNAYLVMDVIRKCDNEIDILDMSFNGDEFIFTGRSKSRVNEIFIENVISFERIFYQINHNDDASTFSFEIPYRDILNNPIKKWEINCEESLNSIKLSDSFEFFTRYHRTRFINARNKILIENNLCNVIDEIHSLSRSNNRLSKQNDDAILKRVSRKFLKFR